MLTITYNNETLQKIEDKKAGKIRNDYSGFYRSQQTGVEYFVKFPEDKCELFTEGFAGIVIDKLKKYGFVEQIYHEALLTATFIKVGNSYGLIQPKAKFDELHKIIGTTKMSGTDRSAAYEILFGYKLYGLLTSQGAYCGLSISLFLSMLLGDYSFHSSNVIAIKRAFASLTQLIENVDNPRTETIAGDISEQKNSKKDSPTNEYIVYGRIDWGAAFRYYGDPDNADVMKPKEYQGLGNIKVVTKNYISFFTNIPGLFHSIAGKAQIFNKKITQKKIAEILLEVVNEVPENMLNASDREKIAKYICIDSFQDACCGNPAANKKFAEDMSGIMYSRSQSIEHMQEDEANIFSQSNNQQDMYMSLIETAKEKPLAIELDFKGLDSDFHNLIVIIHGQIISAFPESNPTNYLSHISAKIIKLTLGDRNLNILIQKFNTMLMQLANRSEACNFWQHPRDSVVNIFATHHTTDTEAHMGHAFIPQLKEKFILERLYAVEVETQAKTHGQMQAYISAQEQYINQHPKSTWQQLCECLTLGYNILVQLRVIKGIQSHFENSIDDPVLQNALKDNIRILIDNIEKFNIHYSELSKSLAAAEKAHTVVSANLNITNKREPLFYPITQEILEHYSVDQLVTVCLDEADAKHIEESAILSLVIYSNDLINRFKQANWSQFHCRRDEPIKRKNLILTIRQTQENFDSIFNLLLDTTDIQTLNNYRKQLKELKDQMPKSLQEMNQAKYTLALEMCDYQEQLDVSLSSNSSTDTNEALIRSRMKLSTALREATENLQTTRQSISKRTPKVYQLQQQFNETHTRFAKAKNANDIFKTFAELDECFTQMPAGIKAINNSYYMESKSIYDKQIDFDVTCKKIANTKDTETFKSDCTQLISIYQSMPFEIKSINQNAFDDAMQLYNLQLAFDTKNEELFKAYMIEDINHLYQELDNIYAEMPEILKTINNVQYSEACAMYKHRNFFFSQITSTNRPSQSKDFAQVKSEVTSEATTIIVQATNISVIYDLFARIKNAETGLLRTHRLNLVFSHGDTVSYKDVIVSAAERALQLIVGAKPPTFIEYDYVKEILDEAKRCAGYKYDYIKQYKAFALDALKKEATAATSLIKLLQLFDQVSRHTNILRRHLQNIVHAYGETNSYKEAILAIGQGIARLKSNNLLQPLDQNAKAKFVLLCNTLETQLPKYNNTEWIAVIKTLRDNKSPATNSPKPPQRQFP